MVYGINNISQTQALNAMNFNGQNGYYAVPQYKEDSFNGKTLLKIVTVASAVMFRKNIAKFVTKHFPQVAKWTSKNVSKPVSTWVKAHKNNFFVKYTKMAWDKMGKWGESVTKYFSEDAKATVKKSSTHKTTAKHTTHTKTKAKPQVKPNENNFKSHVNKRFTTIK